MKKINEVEKIKKRRLTIRIRVKEQQIINQKMENINQFKGGKRSKALTPRFLFLFFLFFIGFPGFF